MSNAGECSTCNSHGDNRDQHLHEEERPSQRGAIAATDLLGFNIRLTREQQAERLESHALAEAHSKDWEPYCLKQQLPRDSKLKKMTRKFGVKHSCRKWVWTQVSGAARLQAAHPSSYFRNLVAAAPSRSKSLRQIELDLPRTFPEHAWLSGPQGQAALRDVLSAYSVHNLKTGYCQSLNFIVAILLLATDRQPETAFWLLVALCDSILYCNLYAPHLPGFQVEMRTLDALLEDKLPQLHRHLHAIGCDMSFLATDWFLCLYATSLPPEVTLRVWDSLFLEGAKILYRVSLALLHRHQHQLTQLDNPGDVLQTLKLGVSACWGAEQLMHAAFEKVGGLPMARIDKIRVKQQSLVDVVVREREAMRRRQDAQEKEAAVAAAAARQQQAADQAAAAATAAAAQ